MIEMPHPHAPLQIHREGVGIIIAQAIFDAVVDPFIAHDIEAPHALVLGARPQVTAPIARYRYDVTRILFGRQRQLVGQSGNSARIGDGRRAQRPILAPRGRSQCKATQNTHQARERGGHERREEANRPLRRR